MIKTSKIWHSPANVYWHIQELTKKVGAEAIENKNKYQKVREARTGAVLAMAQSKLSGNPTYVQLHKDEPPDVILMQISKDIKGQLDILPVEITTYAGQPKGSLLEQLKRTKVKPGIHVLPKECYLVVNVGIELDVEYEPIMEYLNENETPFHVITIQQVSNYPDTIARVVFINPKFRKIDINIGKEAANTVRQSASIDVLCTRRVGKVELVKLEKAEKIYDAPWKTIGV